MTRGSRAGRSARRAAALRGGTAAVVAALALAGCTAAAPPAAQPDDAPATGPEVPTLEAQWSLPGLDANPEVTGRHHWATYQDQTSGIGRLRSTSPGPSLLVDTRTGKARRTAVMPDDLPCTLPDQLSDSGVTPVLWTGMKTFPGNRSPSVARCTTLTVQDASTGRLLWRADVDLDDLLHERRLAADDRVVAVVDRRGRRTCLGARDGGPVADDDASCAALADRVTGADLPPLTTPDGRRVRLPSATGIQGPVAEEVGRTAEVLLLREQVVEWSDDQSYRRTEAWRVRAHDLETGETLWERDLAPDPHGDAWDRTETFFVAPSGVVRVSYEHPEDVEDVADTPMVLTAVDARTGEDLEPLARVEGAWFTHQFDDVLVALTDQERGLRSRISGFRLPTW